MKRAKLRLMPPPSGMNKTEAAFAARLDKLKSDGSIEWYGFECFRLVLGHRCTYTPDFMVMWSDQTVEFFEVKGFWRDDARVKIKTAARRFPMFKFTAVQLIKKEWRMEHIKH